MNLRRLSFFLAFCLLWTACSSSPRKTAGPHFEHVSKVYVSHDCFGSKSICFEETIEIAKKDCEKDDRIYEYESHEVTPTISLRYRCKWQVEP